MPHSPQHWKAVAGSVPLPGDHILVVRMEPARLPPGDHSILSPFERRRVDQLSGEDDVQVYLALRQALRELLACTVGVNPTDIRLSEGTNGKPVPNLSGHDLQFNLSHSGDLALVAVARSIAVGIDIEVERPIARRDAIAQRMFGTSAMSQEEFFVAWTRHEARQKANSHGLFGPRAEADSMKTLDMIPAPGYAAALAYPSRHGAVEVTCLDWHRSQS